QRRNVQIAFVDDNRIVVTRLDGGGATTVMADVTLPAGYEFGLPTGPGDTPDGYGNDNPVELGGETTGTFLADGIFVDTSGTLINGSVFTIGSNNGSARAVTLNGATGRIKQYYLRDNAWVER